MKKQPSKCIYCLRVLFTLFAAASLRPQVGTAQIPFSDVFTNNTLNSGWALEQPNPASTYHLTRTSLNITASWQNGGSDLWPGSNLQASRLLQPMDPFLDWTVETGFGFAPDDNYQGAGIMLADTNGPFASDSDFIRRAERAYYPDGGGEVIGCVSPYVSYSGSMSYMRVQKSGTNYTGWWSADGVNWNYGGTATDTHPWTYMGVFVIRQPWDGVQVDSLASFYYFHVSVVMPSLSIQPVSSNQIALSWPLSATNFVLEATDSLPTSGPWQMVANVPTLSGSQLYVTNALGGGNKFYRLRYP